MENASVSILGCGWIGLPLGGHLSENGWMVRGSTTSPEKRNLLRQKGIEPFVLEIPPGGSATLDQKAQANWESFLQSDALVCTIPPDRRADDAIQDYRKLMQWLMEKVHEAGVSHFVYTSSSGVYPPENREVTEDDIHPTEEPPADAPLRKTARAVSAAEGVIAQAETPYTILRLGGLYGPDRSPARFLAGKTGLAGGGNPINMLHLDDAIGVITEVLKTEGENEVYNVCADEHPSKFAFYTAAARRDGLRRPLFTPDAKKPYKLVDNSKVKQRFGYQFKHPDPMDDVRRVAG